MNDEWLAERFEADRGRLQAVAYRLLGSTGEADDAVQETWLRLSRADTSQVENLSGWLTTVVARVCLDKLRARRARPEEPLAEDWEAIPDAAGMAASPWGGPAGDPAGDPAAEALLAESVRVAMLAVLQRLAPAERVAFVLHDVFGVSFNEIAGIVGRSPSPRANSPAAAGAGCRALRRTTARPTWRGTGTSSRHSSGPRGGVTSPRCWPCSLRTSCYGPTRRPGGWPRGPAG